MEFSGSRKVVDTGETPSQKAKDQTTEAAVGIQNPSQTSTDVEDSTLKKKKISFGLRGNVSSAAAS